MRYNIEIETSKDIDSVIFEIYRDIKRRKFVTKKEIPTEMEKVDCECETDTKYRIR